MSEFEKLNNLPPNTTEQGELNPEELGIQFNSMSFIDFRSFLRDKIKEDASLHFDIIADWHSKQKTRAAKALIERASELNIDSITIRATKEQCQEDVNAFQSGVKWEEI